MGFFYSVSDKQLRKDFNKMLKEDFVKPLEVNGFTARPFSIDYFGEYDRDIQGYVYAFGRISKEGCLEYIHAYCMGGSRWIYVEVNIICASPKFKSIDDLKTVNQSKFINVLWSFNRMRIRVDDYDLLPPYYILFMPCHKLGTYWTKSGYAREIEKLKHKVVRDLENIDAFIDKWHRLHKPKVLDWDGNEIS